MEALTKEDEELVEEAKRVAVAFSQEQWKNQNISSVASAVRMKDGSVYSAPNIFHPDSSPSCLCAEQVALGIAYKDKKREADTLVAYWYDPKYGEGIVSPCGRCRDFLNLFGDPWVIVERDGNREKARLGELYPFPNKW